MEMFRQILCTNYTIFGNDAKLSMDGVRNNAVKYLCTFHKKAGEKCYIFFKSEA